MGGRHWVKWSGLLVLGWCMDEDMLYLVSFPLLVIWLEDFEPEIMLMLRG